MLTSLSSLLLAFGASTLPITQGGVPQIEVRVDSAHREITLTARGISIPAGMTYAHHALESAVRFQWPVDGWVHGYRLDVVDSSGRAMPRTSFHHGGVANLDRRQLAYPIAERLFAAGQETRPVTHWGLAQAQVGPLAAPGKYSVRLSASGQTVTRVTLRRINSR